MAERGARAVLAVVLLAVALLVHCTPDTPVSTGVAHVAMAIPAGDPLPADDAPACPPTHPMQTGVLAPVQRVAGTVDLLPLTPVADLGPACGPADRASPRPGPAPALATGGELCTLLCVSRR